MGGIGRSVASEAGTSSQCVHNAEVLYTELSGIITATGGPYMMMARRCMWKIKPGSPLSQIVLSVRLNETNLQGTDTLRITSSDHRLEPSSKEIAQLSANQIDTPITILGSDYASILLDTASFHTRFHLTFRCEL